MSEEPKTPKGVEALATVATAAASAGVTLTALSAAGIAMVPSAIGGLAGVALQAYGKSLEQKADRWFQLVADILELGSPEEAAEAVQENIDEPWAHKSVVEGVRAILNDIDDVALPALAKIVARRLKSKSPPDRRDKLAIQLLCDCDHEDHGALTAVMKLSKQYDAHAKVLLVVNGEGELVIRKPGASYADTLLHRSKPPTGWERIFFLLKKYEFGTEFQSGTVGGQSGPNTVDIKSEDLRFLCIILDGTS